MNVTQEDVARVQKSFATLTHHLESHANYFYEALFKRAPELRGMFRDDLVGQGMKFMTTLRVIVEKLDDEEHIATQFKGLGHAHASLGIHQSHFAPMGEALMDTLKEALGDDFDAQTEASWRKAYDLVSINMIRRGSIPE